MSNKWTIEKIEKTMLNSVYNDKSKMASIIERGLIIYKKAKVGHPEIKNRISILEQLKEKYQ